MNRAQIDVPAPLGHVMGVADVVSKLRPFAAHFTYLCHCVTPEIDSEGLVQQLGLQSVIKSQFYRRLWIDANSSLTKCLKFTAENAECAEKFVSQELVEPIFRE